MLTRFVSACIFAASAVTFAACSSTTDPNLEPNPDAGPGKKDGGDDGDKPPVEEDCGAITPKTPPGEGEVCAVEKGTGSGTLYVGEVLQPGKISINGQVLVDDTGTITCAGCGCVEKAAEATRVICPDAVISPGLINAHDHGGWLNGAPATATDNYIVKGGGKFSGPPDPQALRFEHRNDWRPAGNGNSPKIDEPGGNASADQKLYGEVRMAFGGAVMSFESTSSAKFIRLADDAKKGYFPEGQSFATYETFPIGSAIQVKDDPANPDCSKYQYKAPPGPGLPWIPHVSEGIDIDARNEFLCLTDKVAKGKNYLDARTAIIHGVGLTTTDINTMAQKGAKLVWSPRSNISLYGETARVTEFDKLGVPIGLGTDWLPSGSMNVLRELACADEFNQNNLGGYFSDEKLWLMATRGAAQALGFDGVTGELAEGKTADIAIFAKNGRKAHRAVIGASEEDVALVLRSGKVLVGASKVVAALEQDCDEVEVCGAPKRVCLSRDTGKHWSDIEGLPNMYALAACGTTPPDEPTCLPARTLATDVVASSTKFAGMSSADDTDGDGIPNGEDNCPTVFNPARPLDKGVQENSDGDELGDACDPCPFDKDATSCSKPDQVKTDSDGDGVENTKDNCPNKANADQKDGDKDGVGDVCDTCPSEAGPNGGCPAQARKISELWTLGDDINAKVENVCVTALRPTTRIWVQDPTWTTGSATSGGILVFFGNGGLTAIPAGINARDKISLEGKTTTYQGVFELTEIKSATVVEANSPSCTDAALVKAVTAAEVQPGGANEMKYRFMLAKLTNLTVAGPDTTSGMPTTRFLLQGSTLKVTNYIAGAAAFNGATFSVGSVLTEATGVLDYFSGNQLAPRTRQDMLP